MNGMQVRIVKNLKDRVHPVNMMTATNGINDALEAELAISDLIVEGIVDVEEINVALEGFTPVMKKLYRLSASARLDQNLIGIRRVA